MYDSQQQTCPVLRILGNTVAKGDHFGPRALALSNDGGRLAFIGPLEFTVTVLDAETLNEVASYLQPGTGSPVHAGGTGTVA